MRIHCGERGQHWVKGLAYPVATYRVVDSHEGPGAAQQCISEEAPSVRLDIDPGTMTPGERRHAVSVLKKALDRLAGE